MIRKILLWGLMTLIVFSASLEAEGEWKVYFSQSSVKKILADGDTLLCATDGGVMLFDMADSTFQSYYGEFDLRSSFAVDAAMDSQGDLWAGFKFHGVARVRDPFGQPDAVWFNKDSGVFSDSITCLASVEDEVYYGSSNGLGKFFQGIHTEEDVLSDFLEGDGINEILVENDSILWVAGSGGITRFNRKTLAEPLNYDIDNPLSITSHGGIIHIITEQNVQKLEDGSWSLVGGTDWVVNQAPLVQIASGGGELYCASSERVYKWNGASWLSLDVGGMKMLFSEEYGSYSRVNLTALAVDGSGNPWIGGVIRNRYRGVNLCFHDGSIWRTKRPNQLTQNDIRRVSNDPEGGVWVSTRLYGVCYFSGSEWLCYTDMRDEDNDDALSFNYDNIAMLCDSRGRVWSSALNYPVDMIDTGDRLSRDDDVWRHYSPEEELISSRHVNVRQGPSGNIWFLSDGANVAGGEWGIDIIDSSGFEWVSFNPGNSEMPSGNLIDCVFGQGRAYMALDEYGVAVWIPQGFDWQDLTKREDDQWYTLLDGGDLATTDFYSLEIDGSDLWVGTSAGLFKRNGDGSITEYTSNSADENRKILNNTVRDLQLDQYGKLWVASEGGIDVIGPGGDVISRFTTYDYWKQNLEFVYPDASSVISYLPSAFCSTLTYVSQEDRLWIGTDNGLASVDVRITRGPSRALSDLILHPNPVFVSNQGYSLMVSGISSPVNVKVYNIEGELVHEKSGISDGEEVWDLLTMNGYKAVSGIYIVRVEGDSGVELRKVAVVR